MNFICCQIGSRDHYAVPRALYRRGLLDFLLTDAWTPAGNYLPFPFPSRFHPELTGAQVAASNFHSFLFELRSNGFGYGRWQKIVARNNWFQRVALAKLSKFADDGIPRTVFAYSYAAREIFQFARLKGWRTVLGQIDAGPREESIVELLHAKYNGEGEPLEKPPQHYWENWRQECALADRIIVNSWWSKKALESAGISESKVQIVPLAYQALNSKSLRREYPTTFTSGRPLRVLFLGTICLRKGVGQLFDSIRLLRSQPIEFWFVGARQVSIPVDLRINPRIHWIDEVPSSETAVFYRDADVFIFPTHSDGFGLTQLEAQAMGLPIIASRNCGNVVEDGRNGFLLKEITGEEIAQVLQYCVDNPANLDQMSRESRQRANAFEIDPISHYWTNIFQN
jgi:glycosyltransferase involved in cell wall biosynthesis